MKTTKLLSFFLALSSLSACQTNQNIRGYIIKIGDIAPLFETTLTNGNTLY